MSSLGNTLADRTISIKSPTLIAACLAVVAIHIRQAGQSHELLQKFRVTGVEEVNGSPTNRVEIWEAHSEMLHRHRFYERQNHTLYETSVYIEREKKVTDFHLNVLLTVLHFVFIF